MTLVSPLFGGEFEASTVRQAQRSHVKCRHPDHVLPPGLPGRLNCWVICILFSDRLDRNRDVRAVSIGLATTAQSLLTGAASNVSLEVSAYKGFDNLGGPQSSLTSDQSMQSTCQRWAKFGRWKTVVLQAFVLRPVAAGGAGSVP